MAVGELVGANSPLFGIYSTLIVELPPILR